jgi:hypothetical protein
MAEKNMNPEPSGWGDPKVDSPVSGRGTSWEAMVAGEGAAKEAAEAEKKIDQQIPLDEFRDKLTELQSESSQYSHEQLMIQVRHAFTTTGNTEALKLAKFSYLLKRGGKSEEGPFIFNSSDSKQIRIFIAKDKKGDKYIPYIEQ